MSVSQHENSTSGTESSESSENKVENATPCILEKGIEKVENRSEPGLAEGEQKLVPSKETGECSPEKAAQQPISVKDYLARLIPLPEKSTIEKQEESPQKSMPNKTAPSRRIPHLHKLEKKHSSGDLHSRLKTRKLLGVGETDDGDVHRSKLSQILGHSDQLYIKLPNGLRLWQIVLSTLLTVMAVWALVFPSHFFKYMYEMDSSGFTFPIRLYASALVCISIVYWSTIQVSDRESIRLVLLSSIVFFALQSLIIGINMLTNYGSSTRWTVLSVVLAAVMALIGYLFLSGVMYPRMGGLKRTSSNKEISEKEH